MGINEPHVRRRGFFLHSETTGEPDTGEYENPEGFVVRVRAARSHPAAQPRPRVISSSRGGRSQSTTTHDEGMPAIRSGSATGSRQRAHMSR
jgi:hypothetical protein